MFLLFFFFRSVNADKSVISVLLELHKLCTNAEIKQETYLMIADDQIKQQFQNEQMSHNEYNNYRSQFQFE